MNIYLSIINKQNPDCPIAFLSNKSNNKTRKQKTLIE